MIRIAEIGPERLNEYDRVPSQFVVRSILEPELVDGGLGGIWLHEVLLAEPYVKDYDFGEKPSDWARQFDVRKWGFFLAATHEGKAIGAAAVAFDTTGVSMLERRRDLSVLWDIRVAPEGRGAGIALFRRAAAWSKARGCVQMKIETQNVNVPACRFYHRMGARLGEIHRYGYAAIPGVAHEVMLCWYLDL